MLVNLFKCTNCNKEVKCSMDILYVCTHCKSRDCMEKIKPKPKMKKIELIITPMKLKRNKLQDALGICDCGQAMYRSEEKKIMYCPKCHPEIGTPVTYDPNEAKEENKLPVMLQKTINKYPKVSSKQISKRIIKEKKEVVPEEIKLKLILVRTLIAKRVPKNYPKKIIAKEIIKE